MKLNTQCQSVPARATMQDLQNHQQAIKAKHEEIHNLQNIIAGKRAEIAAKHAAIPLIDHIAKARQDLMASVAIGQASQNDLADFDKKSAKEKADHAKAKSAAQEVEEACLQTIAGLERKLDEARSALDLLSEKNRPLLKSYLLREATEAAEKYVAAVKSIKLNYLRLTALDNVLITKRLVPNGFACVGQPLVLPAFNLPICKEMEHRNHLGIIYSDQIAFLSGDADGAMEKLLCELKEDGIDFA